eukprot:TRINITY_DN61512_c0_g1_i1.p1 TRINITY_DN61512_c0_g1~~TRINITY_DN61512_c0_g1_i1.p1  ORF type:complete len:349 (+),score=34.49 TRINITY_DN61512_c0_g1_i1:177-1223(+)
MAECSATSRSLLDNDTITLRKQKAICLHLLAFITVWWSSAVVVVVMIGRTVKPTGIFPHPFTFTGAIQAFAAIAAWLFSVPITWQQQKPVATLRWTELGILWSIGLMQGFEIGLTNKALQLLLISTRTMLNSLCVLFLMISAWIWKLERLGTLRLTSAAVFVAGGVLQCFDHADSSGGSRVAGIIMQFVSITLAAQRCCMMQLIMQHSHRDSAFSKMSKLSMLARVLPWTGGCCFVLGWMFEPDAFSLTNIQLLLLRNTCVISVFLAIMLWMEYLLINRISAVAFNVLSTVHQIPLVLAGVLFQRNQVHEGQVLGFATCIIGALIYGAAHHVDSSIDVAPSDGRCEQD